MRWPLDPAGCLSLRRLIPADVDVVVDLAGRAFDSPHVRDEVRAMLNLYCTSGSQQLSLERQAETMLPVSYYVLARNAGFIERLIGLTGLYRPIWAGSGVYWLGWFAVDPTAQGHGYGRRLLEATLTLAATRGGRLLCVETSEKLDAAVRLYHRLGFRRYGTVPDYWAPGSPLVILARHLHDIPRSKEIPDEF